MQSLNKYFNKKKLDYVTYMSNIINIIHKLIYEVQIQIDRQYRDTSLQFKQLPHHLIEQACTQMESKRGEFHQQIIEKLYTLLKENDKANIYKLNYAQNKQTKKQTNQKIQVQNKQPQQLKSSSQNINSSTINNKWQHINEQIPLANRGQTHILKKNYTNIVNAQTINEQSLASKAQTKVTKDQNESNKIASFYSIRYDAVIDLAGQNNNASKEQPYNQLFVDHKNSYKASQLANESFLRNQSQNERQISKYNLVDNVQNSLTQRKNGIVIARSQSVKNDQAFTPTKQIQFKIEDNGYPLINSLKLSKFEQSREKYNSPSPSNVKKKIEILKKSDICECLDKIINKQAKQMLQRSQTKNKLSTSMRKKSLQRNELSPSKKTLNSFQTQRVQQKDSNAILLLNKKPTSIQNVQQFSNKQKQKTGYLSDKNSITNLQALIEQKIGQNNSVISKQALKNTKTSPINRYKF